ncbi:hypothetical protein W7S_20185 [Mycobacterium sp. MOTT36Y]|nr:hypothetical protein W7S_20185 [Mycobacterium sp. MOTT36Y]
MKLASGFVELTVKKAGNAMKEITAEITGVGKAADKAGQQAGKALNDGITKGVKDAGKSVSEELGKATKTAEKVGKDAGEALNKGVSKGAKDAGKSVNDELGKATKRTGDSIVKDLGSSILEAARQGAKDAGTTLEAEMGKAAAKAGRAIGNAIGDSPLGGWVRSLGVDGDQVISVMDGIGKSITGVKNQDIGGTLTGIGDALNGIGQSDAANVFEKIGTVAGNAQQSFRDIKGDIEDTATGLGLLATNSPKAAKGLESIGAAAGPIGLTVTAAKELDDALTQLGVAKYAEVPGSALWFMHQLSNGFSGVKDFLSATPFGGPDPTKGVQLPENVHPKPGVSAIPLPGSAPAVEDGYTAVTGSMNPFAALAPQGKPGAAPSGNSGGAPAVPLVQTASGTWTSPNPAWAHLIGRESSGINQRQGIIDANSGGNEAEGLFQITPRTWAAHGGTSFAPSAIAATPQQQAQIAARILQSNPSGSDWGAGLPGRENAAALLQGLVPTGFDDGGPLPPGLQLVNNASGKPEIVLTQDQAKNALQGIPGAGAGPSDTPLSSGQSPGPNGAAALTALTGAPAGSDLRTQGYIPAGAGGGGQAGTSLWSGAMQMGASAVNGLIEQAASAASTAISAAAAAGSFGAGGQAGGAASQFLIGVGTKMAERGVQYGFQLAGIGGDALAEILLPFGVPRFFQTDPSQFMPQLPGQAAAVTTGEKAEQQQDNPGGGAASPAGPVQPGQMPGQQVVGQSVPLATEGTGNFTPAPVGAPGLSPSGATPSLAPTAPLGPQAPKSGPMAPQPDQPPVQPKKPQGPLDFVPLDMPGVFDDGGWLQPNGIAVNLSNKPEPILNADQWGDMHAIAAQGMPQLDPKAANGYAPNFSVNIDSVTVKDVNELQREIDSRQRLQMWRYAGRP